MCEKGGLIDCVKCQVSNIIDKWEKILMPKCIALRKHGGQRCVEINMQNGRKKRDWYVKKMSTLDKWAQICLLAQSCLNFKPSHMSQGGMGS